MLVLAIAKYLDKLFKDGSLATATPLGELGGVMVVAVNLAIMLVITVLGAEYGWAKRACEVIDMILAVKSSYIRSSECTAALMAQEI